MVNLIWHIIKLSRWRHQMETFSALLAIFTGNSPVPGEFHAQRPVTRSFDVFFDLRLNKKLSKQAWCWRFETLSRPLWHHRNVYISLLRQYHLQTWWYTHKQKFSLKELMVLDWSYMHSDRQIGRFWAVNIFLRTVVFFHRLYTRKIKFMSVLLRLYCDTCKMGQSWLNVI